MNFLIVFLLPSVLAIKLFIHLNNEKKVSDMIIYYSLFALFSNCISMILVAIKNKTALNLVEYATNNYIFSIKYIILMVIVNIFLAILFTIIKKYFYFTIEVENGKKKKKNK